LSELWGRVRVGRMSGKSDFSKRCLKYYRVLITGAFFTAGNFLLYEHLFRYGGFDIELLGHEWYGLMLILIGTGLSIKWGQLKGVVKAIKNRNIKAILDQGERDGGD